MKFLVDEFGGHTGVKALITEDTKGDKKYYIKGRFAQAELKNRNGRIYPRSVMEEAVKGYQKLIKANRAVSELNHPEQPSVNLERVSHMTESLEWDGNDVIGKARILTQLPQGIIAKGLIDEGVQLGVSTRGLGNLIEKDNANVVQPGFIMTAIDIVSDPSAPDAFVTAVMESASWVYNAGTNSWMIADQMKKQIQKMSSKQVAENQAAFFESFLRRIK